MIPWLKKLLWDESAFERSGRAVLLMLGGLVATGQLPPWVPEWIAAPLLLLAGLIGAGDKNLTLPELKAEAKVEGAAVVGADLVTH